jgi:hypothetical protein
MLLRRFTAMLALVAMASSFCGAFTFDNHVEITKQALSVVINRLPIAWHERAPWGFSGAAVKEITDANKSKDTGDCGTADGFIQRWNTDNFDDKSSLDVPAKPCELADLELLSALQKVMATAHADHFDAEYIRQGSDKLFAARQEIVRALQAGRAVAARKLLGGALHGIQDFYAHSNWVELQYGKLEDRLGSDPTFDLWSLTWPHIAGPDTRTCATGTLLMQPSGFDLLPNFFHPTSSQIQQGDLLTSGYFFKSLIDTDDITTRGKCRHGWELATLNQAGIHHDDKSRRGFENAETLALVHSENFTVDLVRDNAPLQKEPGYFLALMGYPTITAIKPTSTDAGVSIGHLQVTGLGFSVYDPRTKPTVLWNGKPMLANPVVNPPDPSVPTTTLDVLVDPADLAQPGKVTIRVRQYDLDENGSVTSTVLDSQPFTFTINGKEPDCPGDPRHVHDKSGYYMDVNANRWNDAGVIGAGYVVPQFPLNVVVKKPATVVWRTGLIGASSVAPPEGDPLVTPRNTPLWIDPQMPNVPIGALIGMIIDLKFIDPNPPLNPTIPLIEKPQGNTNNTGITYFKIGGGGKIPVPAAGRLFLGINDGAFFNNAGCFQVHIDMPQK